MSDPPQPNTWHFTRLLFVAASLVFMGVVFFLLLAANMEKELSHDEHMYVSGGALMAERLQVPYRDFPYLQMPNLAFAYAGLFSLLGWPGYFLLEARIFSTACATAGLGLVFAVVAGALRGVPYGWRCLAAAGSVVAIMANPVFRYASGQAWNHDAAVLLALAAFVTLHAGARRGWHVGWTLLGGLLLGLAVGTRLTFAFVVPVYLAAVLLYPSLRGWQANWKSRLRPVMTFGDGLLAGLAPSLIAFLMAPRQFVFGNIEYHQVNALFWEKVGYDRTMDMAGKLDYLWAVVAQPANLVLTVGALSFLVAGLVARRGAGKPWRFELLSAGAMLPALLVGALAPTPSWYQYFYALVPFMVLIAAYGAASLYPTAKWGLAVFGLMLLLLTAFGQPSYSLRGLADPAAWVPVEVHNVGMEVSRYAGGGKVLTFAPIYALEGGADIYDLFAVGPFLLRSGSLLPPNERRDLGVPSQDEFMQSLEREPPGAILTGFEEGLETPWIRFAQARGYEMVRLPGEKVLWLLRR
jgi:4-amino-4-deoxy-L-arabinose transferase-like glycosyltransferase